MRIAYRHVDRMLRRYLGGHGSYGEFREWANACDPRLYDAALYARIAVPVSKRTREDVQHKLDV